MEADNSTNRKNPDWWEPLWDLVVHVLVGTLLFAIVFAPAVGLEILIHWLEENYRLSQFLIYLLVYTKYIIAAIDAILYVLFMIRMGWQFFASLFHIERTEGDA